MPTARRPRHPAGPRIGLRSSLSPKISIGRSLLLALTLGCALATASTVTGSGPPETGGAAEAEPESAVATETDPTVRRMSLTFDDLPAQSTRAETAVYAEITRKLLATLDEAEAPAVGFVNEKKLEVEGRLVPARRELLADWLRAGHELGNHTYSHPNLHATPVPEYLADIEAGERHLRPLSRQHGKPLRYFRHPMLRTGRSLETKAAVGAKLDALGYTIAPVSIDNSEWIYARAYDVALDDGDRELADRIAASYLTYMDSVVAYYEQQSEAILGYELPQILLLHANRLNAETLPRLLALVRERGYRFVTLEEALEDEAYARPDRYLGPAGITWLHRWALEDGKRGTFFAGEPEVPAFVQEASGL